MTTAENKRRHARFTVEGAAVNAKTIFNTEVEINDISIGGASVSCTRRLTIGCEYLFKFEHRNRVIPVKGVVVWAKLTGGRRVSDEESVPVYTFGVEFTNAAERQEELEEFVSAESGQVRVRRLSKVRIKINAPEKAIITSTENCAVTEMGVGGIRLEMEEAPPAGTLLTLELALSDAEKSIDCGGKIAFSNAIPGTSPDRYSVGIEFTYVSDEDRHRLEKFVASLPRQP